MKKNKMRLPSYELKVKGTKKENENLLGLVGVAFLLAIFASSARKK